MPKRQSKIEKLIAEFCPEGVEFRHLRDVARIRNGKDYKVFGEGSIPVYGTGGIMTRIDTAAYENASVLIPRKGSLNKLYFVEEPFWTVDTIFYTEINEDLIVPKFFYYFLITQRLEDLNQAGGVPSLTQKVLNEIAVPIPPLAIQQEIVKILDTFTTLEAELEAELESELKERKKQYEYYRDELLTFGDDVEWKTLNEIGKVSMCKRIFKNETLANGDIPFYKIGTFGKQPNAFIPQELFDEYRRKFSFPKKGDVLLSASGTIGRRVIYNGEPAYFQDSNIIWIDNDENMVLNKFLYYFYAIIEWKTEGGTIQRLYNDNLKKIKIPIPPLAEQERTVAILDKFDALVNDISVGLPAEINTRRKQYEYYRNKLLTFKQFPSSGGVAAKG
jgi:type I restriction enzyme, S subunit